ncbi:MAG: hypothetical protein NFCOHLIN_02753 [Gammaproteobacteria bacterium]|nr:hypothetical protein [Gammaproteobacteria bacterium]
MNRTSRLLSFAVPLTLAALVCGSASAVAGEVDMRDYIMLDEGMTEAEVLYRLGPYDYETVYSDYYHLPIRKRWAYLPAYGKRGWVTEITFDHRGRIQQIERYRP